jgi:FlaG/FlaF family flagellin (archaellin)
LNKIIFGKRRAVSETIATMMLLTITVIGAVMVSGFVSDGFFSGVDQSPSGGDSSADSIQLTGYDTRDSDTLINVINLDNFLNVNDPTLCAKGNDAECTIVIADDIPSDDGTEFIALQLRNMNPNSVYLQNIQVNNVLHAWDDGTASWSFDATLSTDAGTKYPRAGFFSIIPSPDRPNSEKQFASQEVKGNEEVRVIIKLSENLSDIKMWDSMQIVVNFGGNIPANFIVASGDAKW